MSEIIQVPITNDMFQRIQAKAQERGILNKKTLVSGEGNIAGFAGEEIVKAYMPFLKDETDSKFYDFIFPNGYTVDVKSKGNCKFAPLDNYDCTIPEYQANYQTADMYIFTRISNDLKCGWICGAILKKQFLSIAKVRKKGQDYNNLGRQTVGNHLVCSVSDLKPINLIKKYYETSKNL